MVISQRLVKKLCPHCGTPQKIVDPIMQSKVSGYLSNVIEDDVADIDFYKATGCEKCDSS
jgi:type II secretory ATPase GspE/PulE/Tfp pilus assembly ATPase PilB-like protein